MAVYDPELDKQTKLLAEEPSASESTTLVVQDATVVRNAVVISDVLAIAVFTGMMILIFMTGFLIVRTGFILKEVRALKNTEA